MRALVTALLVLLAAARHRSLTVDKDGRRHFLVESFGFDEGGAIDLTFKSLSVEKNGKVMDPSSPSNVGFFLRLGIADGGEAHLPEIKGCYLDENANLPGSHHILRRPTLNGWMKGTISEHVKVPGNFDIFFVNCEPDSTVSMKLDVELFNVKDGKRIYTSAGEASLPYIYGIFTLIHIASSVVWFRIIRKDPIQTKRIHWLMFAVVSFKAANLFFEAIKEQHLKNTGIDTGAATVFYYGTSFAKGMLLFAVIVLIGSGYSYMRPFLTSRDKKILLSVLLMQLLVNVALVITEEESPGEEGWSQWRNIFHILDILCCCATLFPISFSIKHLKDAASDSEKAAENLSRLRRLRRFYLITIAYIYFTRIITLVIGATLYVDDLWIRTFLNETAAVCYFVYTGYLFRPGNSYIPLGSYDADDPDAIEFGLGDEEIRDLERHS